MDDDESIAEDINTMGEVDIAPEEYKRFICSELWRKFEANWWLDGKGILDSLAYKPEKSSDEDGGFIINDAVEIKWGSRDIIMSVSTLVL